MIRKHFRSAYRKFLSSHEVNLVSVEDAYPNAKTTLLLPEAEVETPETSAMEFESFSAYLDSPTCTARAVHSYQLDGALYCPINECIVTPDREVIAESTGPGARGGPIKTSSLRISEVEDISGIVAPLRCLYNDYYHMLIDLLPRFDLLHHEAFDQFEEIKVVYNGQLSELEAYFLSRLSPSRVTLLPLTSGLLYRPETVLLNDFITQRSSGYLRGGFIDRLHRRCLPSHPLRTAKRIYISRTQATKGRRILNETALAKALESCGFESVVLEQLPIEQQIDIFRCAECVVAPHGAGLANLIFAVQTKVLELFASPYVVPHYYMLAKSLGHEYAFLPGDQSHHDDNFSVDIDVVLERVNNLLQA